MLSVVMLSVDMLSVVRAKCRYAECHGANGANLLLRDWGPSEQKVQEK